MLSELCVRRPVSATMLVMSLVVLGTFSFQGLGVDLFPKADPATVSVMETVAFPDVDADQPLGWDERNTKGRLTKNGSISGGNSRIAKFLPGYFDSAPDDEINVAVMVNDSTTADCLP